MSRKTKREGVGSAYRLIPEHLKGLWGDILLSLVMLVIYLGCSFLSPQVMGFVLDQVIGEEDYHHMPALIVLAIEKAGGIPALRENLFLCSLLVVVFALFAGIAYYIYMSEIGRAAEGMVMQLRNHIFRHVLHLPFSWHASHPTGEIIQRATSDVEVVRTFVSNQLMMFLRTLVMVSIGLFLMFRMNWRLALITAVFIPVITAYSGFFRHMIEKRFEQADEMEGVLTSVVQENLSSVRVVRAFGREAFELKKFDEKNDAYANRWIKLGYIMGIYWGVGDFASGLMNMAVLVAGTFMCVHHSITIGELLVFISYTQMINWPIRALGHVISEMGKIGVSLRRIHEILLEEPEQDVPDAKKPDLRQDIVFDHVSFSYPKDSPEQAESQTVLSDISFTVRPGMTIGILGSTGSGKSTLMYLLDKLYPVSEGQITIGGVPISEIDTAYLRQNIGFVLQEPFLFSKTIYENIAITQRAEKEELLPFARRVSRTAAVDDAICSFQDGYETMIGEKGVTLSGGQKQRVAIARMLMQNAPVMIFDDSLSAVDTETDLQIREALRRDIQDATVFLIAHRISTIMDADYVLVLENGRIVERGTPAELLAQEGIYRTIYQMQNNPA